MDFGTKKPAPGQPGAADIIKDSTTASFKADVVDASKSVYRLPSLNVTADSSSCAAGLSASTVDDGLSLTFVAPQPLD